MLTISDEEQRDLDDIWLYIARNDPKAADRVVDYLGDCFMALLASPKVGRIRDDLWPQTYCLTIGKASGRSKFLVFYRISEDGIEIARVLEGHQDIKPDWFG